MLLLCLKIQTMKQTIFSILFLLSVIAFANNNETTKIKTTTLQGKVVDNTESLTGVKVTIDNQETVVYTDFDGNFSLENIPVGTHKIELSLITYKNKEVSVDLSQENKIEIKLEAK
ncbi:carboxypeptidase-like regulatory domain-containing protein [Vicingus serpentipes]|uniref:Carboxypeptidase-like regulatory domain-containing protein n=2 Tax=Vicingus serpentipes TaxID=1926625 RepID=A0A5C6RRW5_9FLAO|nr:carboxypeptidase-like regulatory domain-containing protein [Vicingus serpentipes]